MAQMSTGIMGPELKKCERRKVSNTAFLQDRVPVFL